MDIIPAIDLREGRCVRLLQGDFAAETDYGSDPVARALQWITQGSQRLHLVDLDGARAGRATQLDAIAAVVSAVAIPVQVGGGIRERKDAQRLFDIGVQRVILGTVAVAAPDLLAELTRDYPGRVILGLDARDGRIATAGWTHTSDVLATDLLASLAELPLAAVIATDIARDGALTGPNVDAIAALVACSPFPVYASGGVSSAEDVAALRQAGAAGAIVGRALYEGVTTLAVLQAAARDH